MNANMQLSTEAAAILAYWVAVATRYGSPRICLYCHEDAGLTVEPKWWDIEAELIAAGYLEMRWGGAEHDMYAQRDHYLTPLALSA